jgi:hypothetical protein
MLPAAAGAKWSLSEYIFTKTVHDEGCDFSWRALGCVPSSDCKLKFRPRLGSLGPCVKKACDADAAASKADAAAAAASTPAAKPAEPAEPAEPEPAADPEPAKEEEKAVPQEGTEEEE